MRSRDLARRLPQRMRMRICPHCAQVLDEGDAVCAFCGCTATADDKTPAPNASVHEPGAPLAVVPGVAAAKPNNASRNAILVSAAIGAIAVVMFLVRSPRSSAQANAAIPTIAPLQATSHKVVASPRVVAPPPLVVAPPAGSVPTESASAPKWSRTAQSRWATDGSPTIGFEVEAERDVTVYMDRVRPVLAVRCISGQTEVFVVLRSASSIENGSNTHTVRIGLDDQPDVEQRWLDSSDLQALFAPEGNAIAAGLATARRLRFAFKPFNAPPASVEFDVHGFEGPLAAMSKTCAPATKRRPLPLG
jgi:hypothetical protein